MWMGEAGETTQSLAKICMANGLLNFVVADYDCAIFSIIAKLFSWCSCNTDNHPENGFDLAGHFTNVSISSSSPCCDQYLPHQSRLCIRAQHRLRVQWVSAPLVLSTPMWSLNSSCAAIPEEIAMDSRTSNHSFSLPSLNNRLAVRISEGPWIALAANCWQRLYSPHFKFVAYPVTLLP